MSKSSGKKVSAGPSIGLNAALNLEEEFTAAMSTIPSAQHRPHARVTAAFRASSDEPRTIAQRWRFRRDLAMFLAHRAGLSQRILADVFDLPRSRVSVILKEWAEKFPEPK